MSHRKRRLKAAALPSSMRLCAGAETGLALQAAESESSLKKFTMTAYTGGAMQVGFGYPVVVDLEGLVIASQTSPILRDHDPTQIVAHSDSIEKTAQRIKVAGVMSGVSDSAKEVLALAGNSFPWQSSIGCDIARLERVDRGERVTVNGKSFEGPIYVARKATLREVSFVAMGADSATSARVAASLQKGKEIMGEFDKWLEAKGFADATEEQKVTLRATFDAEQLAAKKKADDAEAAKNKKIEPPADDADAAIKARRERIAAEDDRIVAVQKECGENRTMSATAVKEGWTIEKTKYEVLLASRPTGPAIHVGSGKSTEGAVLEAAACQVLGLNSAMLEKQYKPEVLQAAHTSYKGRLSLQELFLTAAWKNGYTGVNFKAEPEAIMRAAWSSGDISGILSNVANKFLLETYMAVESTWRAIASIRPVNDFKAITSYRLTGNMLFEEVANGGEIKHGTMGQQSYANQARTYGKMVALTRTDIINDDLGALAAVPRMLGRGAALKLNLVFWTAFLDNASFFSATHTTAGDTGNANYQEGSATALSIASLTAAELLFLNQVDPNGNPLGVTPKFLLVPNALNVPASQFTRDTEIRDTTASTKYSTSNPHAGKWTAIRSSYLSNAAISGYSALAWYLLADPADVSAIEVCFLNGQDTPVIEQAEADFSVLGVQMRSYFDFGVTKQDYRGGVKSKGEA